MKLKSILLMSAGMLAFGSSFGQSFVTSGTSKYTLLEEGTGTWCGYCPDGAQRIQEKIEPYGSSPNFPHAIAMAFHNGDVMALSPDDFNTNFIGSPKGHGWPGGAIDRVGFTHPNPTTSVTETTIWINRGYWKTDFATRDIVSPTFKVNMISFYNPTTRVLTVTVAGKALVAPGANFNINAYVVEDSISSAPTGYEQHSYMDADPPGSSWFVGKGSILPASFYSHMGVVKKILATSGNIWGDAAFTSASLVGDSVAKTYTFTLPASYNAKHCRVVGVVQKMGTSLDAQGAYNDRIVQNCIRADVKSMYPSMAALYTNNISSSIEDAKVFPNPANNVVNIECAYNTLTPSATTVTILNALGQIVYKNEFPVRGSLFSESVSTKEFSNGVYSVNISNVEGSVTKQIVVNK